MAKYFTVIVVTAVMSAVSYLGIFWYRSAMNTPERAAESFARDLTQDETQSTYDQLSVRMRERYTSEEWGSETALFRKSGAEPLSMGQEPVNDTFNVYPKDSNPQRFTYKYRINDKDYVLSAVLYKQGNSWLVDDFQGDYK